ncbi:MAG TPA: amidohydrolase family protein [Candidatus Acidoferrum sp.]|nr:amidohydrolase family protein [Candidatus Acidoferrum sp.]
MRIDAHQHFWVYEPREYEWIDSSMGALQRDFLPGDLEPELSHNGFDGCVAVQVRQTLEETRWLLELAKQSPFVCGVVGWVDLQAPDLRRVLESFTGNGKLVGVRHIVQSEPDDRFLLRADFLRGIAMLEEFGLAYDILIYTKHLTAAAEFVSKFPRQPFVLDHLAKPPIKSGDLREWERGIRELAKFPNVMAKLSGLVTEADWQAWTLVQITACVDVAFECFGAERLMIGSDWPVCTLAGTYGRVVGVVMEYVARRTPEEREAVLGGNAERFWRLHS